MDRSSDAGFSRNLRAVWRFGWVVAIGICIAALVPLLMLYKAKPTWPPAKRSRAVYVAKTQLLVDSLSGLYFRTQPKQAAPARSKGTTQVAPTNTQTVVPAATDTKSLVDAANLFPLFVQSDEVAAIRRRIVGDLPGTVSAKALYSIVGANRFRPSSLPIMEITAVSPRPKAAIHLAEGTARAFERWLVSQQKRAKISPSQRIVMRELRASRSAVKSGGPSYGLPILVALAILGASIGLAIGADRTWPRARSTKDALEPTVERDRSDGQALQDESLTVAAARSSTGPPT